VPSSGGEVTCPADARTRETISERARGGSGGGGCINPRICVPRARSSRAPHEISPFHKGARVYRNIYYTPQPLRGRVV